MDYNYKELYKKQIQINVKEVLKDIDTNEMRLKISNWADKFGYNFEEIKDKVINDEIFRCVFAKEPSRQNIYQNIAAKIIESVNGIKNFKVLPSGGKNAYFIINGNIFKGENLISKNQDAKSIDFYFEYGNFQFYVSHKYTKDEGGAQDNQYKDIQEFLKNSRDTSLKNTIFLAICDGDYYKQKDSKTGDITKIERLKKLTDSKTVFVITIDELKTFLRKFD